MELERPFSLSEWLETPEAVGRYIEAQEQINAQLVRINPPALPVRIEKVLPFKA